MSLIAQKNEAVELTVGGANHSFPVFVGTENEKGIDIGSLRAKTGYITLDSGYKNTGACQSGITFLDGELGILRYRGYSIEELAAKASFIEVAHLLVNGELPTREQLHARELGLKIQNAIPDGMAALISALPQSLHPMGMLSAATVALSGWYPQEDEEFTPEKVALTMDRLMGNFAGIAAGIYRKGRGEQMVQPDNRLDYVGSFLQMMYGEPGKDYTPDPVVSEALNTLLILHADHEQNCSTSTVRIVGSSHASLYASIAAGISALWGPLHGGANQEVIEMLEAIKADAGGTAKWIHKAKDKNDDFRLMGFGHRVYKNFDPRAKIIKVACDNILNKLGINDPVLEIAKGLEEAALNDDYFKERKLYPNVDFYSGIIYRALGIPTEMFTVMFAIGRLPGWMAQWKEMRDGGEPIGRPRQIYTGKTSRRFVSIEDR
jgi:citrate synthase